MSLDNKRYPEGCQTSSASNGSNDLSTVQPIPVRSKLSHEDFARDFLFPHRPVVIADALKAWPALGKWTPQFFRTRYASKELSIDGHAYSMDELIGLVETSNEINVAPYLRNEQVRKLFPELLQDLSPSPAYIQPNWFRGPCYPYAGREAEIYIGGTGGVFPFLHYDSNSTHAFLGQLYGQKEVILYSPAESHLLYPRMEKKRRHHSQITEVENPDLDAFPLFAKATDEIVYKARSTSILLVLPMVMYMISTGWYKALGDRVNPSRTRARPVNPLHQ